MGWNRKLHHKLNNKGNQVTQDGAVGKSKTKKL